MMKDIQIDMMNGYVLLQDIKDETFTQSGLYIPDTINNRFSRVMKTYEGSVLNINDIVIKPIGRTTPIKVTVIDEHGKKHEEIFDCIREGFIFARIVPD